jgi:hypothetical protein
MGHQLIHRWAGDGWTAMLTRERYGLHFSVGATGRPPTDAEVAEARQAYRAGQWVEQPLVEITRAHHVLGTLNPWVRHYVPEGEAARMYERAAGAAE